MSKVTIDKDLCIGCGSCTSVAPENFSWDADGKAKVINENVTANTENARDYCPTGAVKIGVVADNEDSIMNPLTA